MASDPLFESDNEIGRKPNSEHPHWAADIGADSKSRFISGTCVYNSCRAAMIGSPWVWSTPGFVELGYLNR